MKLVKLKKRKEEILEELYELEFKFDVLSIIIRKNLEEELDEVQCDIDLLSGALDISGGFNPYEDE